MKRYSKALLSTALAATLLAGSALAVAPPVTPGPQESAYTVTDRSLSPIPVWGSVQEKGEDSLSLKNSVESDPYGEIRLTVSEETLVLDAVTGARKTLADLRENETVYAYVGPAMTRSIPPIAAARLVLCNIPADYAVPTYCEVEQVMVAEDGKVSLLTDRDVILHLSQETEIFSFDAGSEDGAVAAGEIVPGTRVLAWYSVVALSMPAQASPDKVMVFPYDYAAYLTLGETGVTVEGDMVVSGTVENGKLLLPLRALAESLGCTVAWDPANQTATVSRDEAVIYAVTIGGEAAQLGDGGLALTVRPKLVDGTTYVALDDLVLLHNLKVSR